MILKSETDGHMGPEELDPRKSTCSLPTDTSQPSEWPCGQIDVVYDRGKNGTEWPEEHEHVVHR